MDSRQPTAIVERLLDDDYVHEQIAAARAGLGDAYRRARRLPPQQAVQDRTLYDHLRRAGSGLAEAARRVAGKPPPEPPRRRRTPLVLVMLAAGAVVLYAGKRQRNRQATPSTPGQAGGSSSTPAAAAERSDQ